MSDKGGGFFMGFLFGALAGAVAALLLAPTSGEELRRTIETKGEDLAGDAERAYDEARDQFGDLQDRGRIVLQDNVKKAQKAVQDAQQKLAEADEGNVDVVIG
jgi:gas vesicle protein